MHTYSTKAAFDRLAKLPKVGGRLYIWIYSHHDEERTFERRILMKMEKLIRPVAWRLPQTLQTAVLLPIVPLYLLHQNLLVKRRGSAFIKYGWRESIHAARDRFTPRYAPIAIATRRFRVRSETPAIPSRIWLVSGTILTMFLYHLLLLQLWMAPE